eukprot:Opistho-2@15902
MASPDVTVSTPSDCFWELGSYKRVVKRVEDGATLCDDIAAIIRERAAIEKEYSKALQAWAKKNDKYLEKSPEFGTLKDAWRAMLTEAESIAEIHFAVSQRVVSEVEANINNWKSEKFHKSILHFKEVRKAEEGFEKAQKAWAKLKGKMDKARKSYHAAARAVEQQAKKVSEAEKNPEIGHDEVKKISDKLNKMKNEMADERSKYEDSLQKLEEERPKYIHEMTQEFEKWQDFEKQRIEYFKDQFHDYHKIVNLHANPGFQAAFARLLGSFDNVDSNSDLANFSKLYGADMDMQWPAFEEYSGMGGDDVSLGRSASNVRRRDSIISSSSAASAPQTFSAPPSHVSRSSAAAPALAATRVDSFDEWDESASGGQQVRALYDYDATDPDELSFREGEIIMQTQSVDENGWCRGTINGRSGLFPANYVEEC